MISDYRNYKLDIDSWSYSSTLPDIKITRMYH